MKTITDKLMVSLILVVILVTLFSCCKSLIPPDDTLSLMRQNYNGAELKIDGYYYSTLNYNTSTYFLYRDGTLYYGGSPVTENIIDQEYRWKNGDYIKDSKTKWGVFVIQDSIIKFERWHPASPHEAIPTYVREGRILNDTTFHITKIYRGNGTELTEANEIYHFRKFSPKPDSTNVFVKQ